MHRSPCRYFSSLVFVYSPSAHIPVVCKVMMQQNTCILIYHNRSHERQRRSMLGSVMGVRAPPRTLALRICRLSSFASRLSSIFYIGTLCVHLTSWMSCGYISAIGRCKHRLRHSICTHLARLGPDNRTLSACRDVDASRLAKRLSYVCASTTAAFASGHTRLMHFPSLVFRLSSIFYIGTLRVHLARLGHDNRTLSACRDARLMLNLKPCRLILQNTSSVS